MHDGVKKGGSKGASEQVTDKDAPPTCGIIMPISATEKKSERHWANVLALLHRAIGAAGFHPANVWAGEVTDRVSERIVGNIFSHEMVVADISDLNPNVMFELGLRLASKKPTVVIANSGGEIPFDIRDFHVISYPGDLNILEMEEFFENLHKALSSKHKAFKEDRYEPFLGKVVVEVASPETRTLPMNELILERLDDLAKSIGRSETRLPIAPPANYSRTGTIQFRTSRNSSTAFYSVPEAVSNAVIALLRSNYTRVDKIGSDRSITYIAASMLPPRNSDDPTEAAMTSTVRKYGGVRGVPEHVSDSYAA